jgi:sec-independent protein translocase protein TatA
MSFLREPSHLLLVAVVVVVLFGSRRLPDAARGLGRSMRIFKSELKQMQDDDSGQAHRSAAEPAEPLEGKIVGSQAAQAAARAARADERTGDARRDV